MNRDPLLSIVVATYNRLPELRTMLDSLLPQVAGQPVEVLVVDDRSTDATWEWLEANLAGRAGIRCLRMEQNSGPGPARNLALEVARGKYFVPFDSDFVIMEGAVERVLRAIQEEPAHILFFFPCIKVPGMQRLDSVTAARCEIDYESFVSRNFGEMIPVASLVHIRERKLAYSVLRVSGEGLLWMRMLAAGPALFLDTPLALYRTDVSGRLSTLECHLSRPGDLAESAETFIELLESGPSIPGLRQIRAERMVAAGTYHLLAGEGRKGRRFLFSALSERHWSAALALAASFGGTRLFRTLFRFYRTKLRRAYV